MDEHKEGIIIHVFKREPMSDEALARYSVHARRYMSRFKFTRRYYVSCGVVKSEILAKDSEIGLWLCSFCGKGTYQLCGTTHKKTKTGFGYTTALCTVEIYDQENKKFKVMNSGKLNHYWFRRKPK